MMRIFVTGGTGYIGSRLIPRLADQGHEVRALARAQSIARLPGGCKAETGNALAANGYVDAVQGCEAFVHLVGVAHPSPRKAREFERVDLASADVAVAAAVQARVGHFIYVSVAHPAPVMHAYTDARRRAEALIRAAPLNATVLRPWYVLGPDHRWPLALLPFYWLAACVPGMREGARRLGLVTLEQMLRALQYAIGQPAQGVRVLDVTAIRAMRAS